MPYVPDHITQEDGSPSQWTNCWAAVGAWLADGASRGTKVVKPSRFRQLARRPLHVPGGMGDVERGLQRMGVWDAARALYDVPRGTLRERLLEPTGSLIGAESEFEVWPVADRCSKSFGDQQDAYHFIGVVAGEGTGVNAGKVRVEDPLCHAMRWVDVDTVVRAIVRYNNEHAGEEKGTADIIVVRPPKLPEEGPDQRAVIALLRQAIDALKEGT